MLRRSGRLRAKEDKSSEAADCNEESIELSFSHETESSFNDVNTILCSDDDDDIFSSLKTDTRQRKSRPRKRGTGGILPQFTSLDALLDEDNHEKKKQKQRESKLKKLKDEKKTISADDSPLAAFMSNMEQNLSSLHADNYLFSLDDESGKERFGYVFTPLTGPLPFQDFKATPKELTSEMGLVYKTMQTSDVEELGALLWSKAILVRFVVGKPVTTTKFVLPTRICSWLFSTMSTHSSNHVIQGCFSNLFVLVADSLPKVSELSSALPVGCFCNSVRSFCNDETSLGKKMCALGMEWSPSIYDFLGAFRKFGFRESKRSMSTRNKLHPFSSELDLNKKGEFPFPKSNMQHVLMFLVICLRSRVLRLDGYDALSFIMFFLKMQFEENIHPQLVQLAFVGIEELLEEFPSAKWHVEWAPTLVLKIAGANEGLFDSAAEWLTVARRLPRTTRGTQLTTGLAVYVLQHRIDKDHAVGAPSEQPLNFPIQSGMVLDLVAGIVENLTKAYNDGSFDDDRISHPPFDLLCKKVALMDLALQAFLNVLTHKEMSIMIKNLDDLTAIHKSSMSAKWHELKTIVCLMQRKYSEENLRIGRKDSPAAKTVLFVD